ncbi:hypothetical protein [Natrinema gelatinilyticum]|uniref:hypothetical protein n=1 Tax=Natrinema gelatinilyticum TaxID=2961571 RepID=UPI0020C22531|nr:hypothetical protein [Natrinema gelatinilyticum]
MSITIGLETGFYRDVFFYADEYVVAEILQNGHITPEHVSQLAGSDLKQENWGKIISRKNLPILSILIAEYSLITGISPNIFYITFPAFLGVWFGFFIIARRIISDQRLSLLIGGIGSLSPYVPVIYTQNVTIFSNVIILMSVITLIYILDKGRKAKFGGYISISIFLAVLFYWYPPNFALVGVLTLLLPFILYLSGKKPSPGILIPSIISGSFFLLIFEIPLSSYLHYISVGISRLLTLSLSSPTSGQTGTYPTVFQPSYYSLISLIALLPMGAVGGLIAFKRILSDRDYPTPSERIAIIWGISILGVALLYMASGESFLVGRPFQLSIPVIIIGVMFTLSKIEQSNIAVIVAVVLLFSTVGGSFYLQSIDQRAKIQTYGAGSEEIGQWGGTHFQGTILSDVKTGAPVAGKGYLMVDHPDQYSGTRNLFYAPESDFQGHVQSKNATGVLLSQSMYRDGLFANQLPHKPMPKQQYQTRLETSNLVYSNGRYHYLWFNQ